MTGTRADTLAALQHMLDTVAFWQGARLAREGRLADAEQLLSGRARAADASAAVLDLLAKVHAQQGRLAEAGKLWARALQADPDNPAIAAALAKATGAQRRAPWIPALRVVVPTFLVLIVVAGAAAMLAYRMSVQQSDTDERLTAVTSQTETLTADIQRLSDALVSAETARGLQADRLEGSIESLRADIEGILGQGAVTGQTCEYRVKDGDTLRSIAADYGIDPWTLARANLIYDLNHIFTGQLLVIPGCDRLPSQ
jgi:tetratricopeptide (TPR) repeat protein